MGRQIQLQSKVGRKLQKFENPWLIQMLSGNLGSTIFNIRDRLFCLKYSMKRKLGLLDFFSILHIYTALLMLVAPFTNTEPNNPYTGQLCDGHLTMSVTISASERR